MVSFAETSARFEASIAAGGGITTSWISKFFSWNTGFLLSAIIGMVILGISIEKRPTPETDQLVLETMTQDSAVESIVQMPLQMKTPITNSDPSLAVEAKKPLSAPADKPIDSIPILSLLQNPSIILPEADQPRPLNLKTIVNNQSDNNSIDSIKTNKPGLKPTAVLFTITESTGTGELASISSQARKAGIEYFYVVDLKKKLIAEFNVNMAIYGTRISSDVQVSVPKKGKFEVTFGWFVDDQGKAIKLSDDITIAEAPAKHPLRITTARKLFQTYLDHGIDHIEQNFDHLIVNKNPKEKQENILNRVGYLFMRENAYNEAIEIFELNTRLFPGKANPWDSLGEAYYKSGNKQGALNAFRKALSINSKLSSSRDWVQKIEKEQ